MLERIPVFRNSGELFQTFWATGRQYGYKTDVWLLGPSCPEGLEQ
ncbi:hypothetical protein [Massilioclostridium coli]|nr:hypothetical protein [Massilioclostridium coli]